MVYAWITIKSSKVNIASDYYCQTQDIFQTRLNKMLNDLLENSNIKENKIYIASAIDGEIGNNSFDHNIGNWLDVIGIFFAYNFINIKL